MADMWTGFMRVRSCWSLTWAGANSLMRSVTWCHQAGWDKAKTLFGHQADAHMRAHAERVGSGGRCFKQVPDQPRQLKHAYRWCMSWGAQCQGRRVAGMEWLVSEHTLELLAV
jgi:hypothetical protein